MSAGSRHKPKDERKERIAQIQAQQRRAEQRRTWMIIGIAGAVAVALIVPAAFLIINEQRAQNEVLAAAEEPIEGVQEFPDLDREHITGQMQYEQTPPVGGPHNAIWKNCGFYDEPVSDVHAVHSLEHGAVWVTYDPELPAADLRHLEALADRHSFLLVSPYEGLASPVVASAWGLQVELDGVDDERLEPFIVRYIQGPQTPEPGAACHGGVGA
ncbi:DUF3105 domain-containing protein [Cellulomonas bogoriensis]|nr:DUF3105 domain-containing protein [Cellulomonas bogoriensis]